MRNKTTTSIFKAGFLALSMSFLLISSTGCGQPKHKEEATACATQFLDAAQNGDFTEAGNHASETVMKNLSWSEEDRKDTLDSFYSSMLASSSTVDQDELEKLRQEPEIQEQENRLLEIEYQNEVITYQIDDDAYAEDSNTSYVTVNVTSSDYDEYDVTGLLSEAMDKFMKEAESFANTFPNKHPEMMELPEDELEYEIMKELIPKFLNITTEEFTQLGNGKTKTENWRLVIEQDSGNMKITDILLVEDEES